MGIKSYRRVELVAKLNFRYYLVSISGRYYIIDYANPSDIKDYFIGIFPKNINIAYLTRSHLILEHFYLFILLSIFSLVLAKSEK